MNKTVCNALSIMIIAATLIAMHKTLSVTHRNAHPHGSFSIGDYIAQNGQPPVNNGVLDLSHKGFTSLDGLNKVEKISTATTLLLDRNHLTELKPRSFQMAPQLRKLNLSHNRLTNLVAGTFVGPSQLMELNLSNNDLKTIAPGTFKGLAVLRRLDIQSNQLAGSDSEFDAEHFPHLDVLINWHPQNPFPYYYINS